MIQQLPDIGFRKVGEISFRKVGEWKLSNDQISYELEAKTAESKNILYAFESGSKILYIGKTTQPLKAQMYGYKNPGKRQLTNRRIKENLTGLLRAPNCSVSIFVLPDPGLLMYGGFHLNLAAGLKDDIIFQLQPEWNINGLA